jgi:flagellar motor switch protein FliN/FliY
MAGDSPTLRQEDIEDLLRHAQMAAGLAEPAPPAEAEASAAYGGASDPAPQQQAAQPQSAGPSAATAVLNSLGPLPAARSSAASTVGDDINLLLAQAEQAIASVDQPVDPVIEGLAPFEFKDLGGSPASGDKATLELLKDVDLDLRIELGRTQMFLEDVLKLKRGSVVALDKLAGDPVDVYVNGRMVARGEVLVLNDNFCVRVTELLAGDDFE